MVTHFKVNIKTLGVVALTAVECEFEQLESEYVVVTVNGELAQLDAENGELTEHGKTNLKLLLAAT